MNFSQGHTPQSRAGLSTSHATSEAHRDAISHALKEALKAKLDAPDAHNRYGSPISEEYRHNLAIVREAVQRVALLPAALLPEDLPLSDVLVTSRDLTRATLSDEIIKFDKAKIDVILKKARKSLDLLGDFPNLPPLSTELGPPRHFDYGATIKRVRIGVLIELSTIPLYLYAMHSVKPQDEGLRVRALLRGIVQQEMLHLALCGNLLSALGGSVALYDPRVVPIYPATLLCSKIPAHLEALNTGSLGRFMEIEAPVDATHPSSRTDDRGVLASQYESIGQLYEDVVLSVRGLEDQQFTNNLNNQFVGQDFFGDQLFAITDKSTALKALATIIEQGEGNLSVEDSHYEVFSKLYSGPAPNVYKAPVNPKTEDYKLNPYVYRVRPFNFLLRDFPLTHNSQLSLSYDAAYCYLLQTIQRVWQTENISDRLQLLRNIHGIMSSVLTPLAELLIQQEFKDGCAAPCFDYYPMQDSVARNPLVPVELHKALAREVEAAATVAPSDNEIGAAAQIAANKAADGVKDASAKANDAAPESADAKKAKDIAEKVESVANGLETNDVAEIVELATQIGKDAVQVAIHTQAAARIGTKINIKAAREAADAAVQVNEAGEAAGKAAGHASEKALLERLKCYIEDNLYPPY
ncbi:Ferritin-like domain containing protein [Amanita muscaria]